MFQALWKVAVHVISSFTTAYNYAIEHDKQLLHTMLKAATIRVGLYMDSIIREFQSSDLHQPSWQDELDQKVGHIKWVQSLSVAFSDSVAGIMKAPTGVVPAGAASSNADGVSVTSRHQTQLQPPDQQMGSAMGQISAQGVPAQALPPTHTMSQSALAAPLPRPPRQQQLQVQTSAAQQAQDQLEFGATASLDGPLSADDHGSVPTKATAADQKSTTAGAVTPGMEPIFELGAKLQKGSKGKWRWYTLRTVQGEGMCLCKYNDEQAAEGDKDLDRTPKSRLPLYAVQKVVRMRSDVTEFVKIQGQTNRFKVQHAGGGAMELQELRADESDGVMPFLTALERYAPVKSSILELSKDPRQDVPSKWMRHCVVLMRYQIVCFDGKDASSMKPKRVFHITAAARARVVPQSILAEKQPWLTLGKQSKQKHRSIEYVELAHETGAQVYQRSLVLRAVPGKSMQGFLDQLGSVALQEGLPPQ